MRTRGVMNEKVKPIVRYLVRYHLGREEAELWSFHEIRLLPYLLIKTLDHACVDPAHISQPERVILSRWRQKKWLSGGASSPIIMTRPFWEVTQKVLWECYAKDDMENPDD